MRHWLLLVLALAAAVALSKLLFEDLAGVRWTSYVRTWLTEPTMVSAAGVVLLLLFDLFLPVPSSLVMISSGVLFGVVGGGLLSLAGSLAGNYLGFALTRTHGRGPSKRLLGDAQFERMSRVFARGGAIAIIVSRPLPIMMETLSLVAGLSTMSRSTFLLSSLVGTAPVAFAYAYAGALSLERGNILPAVVILVSVVAGAWLLARSRLATGREAGRRGSLREGA